MLSYVIITVSILALTTPEAKAQDVSAGEASFRKCQPCHDVGENARNKVGPKLNGLEGRKSGTTEDYSYSEANKNANITWSAASFKDYIADPREKMPGTKMIFPGIKNEKEAEDLWAYLSQFKPEGTKK